MSVLLVTYDLRAPGRNYQPVWDYLKRFTYCKSFESVWFLDTPIATSDIRDHLKTLVDQNDRVFVGRLTRDWSSIKNDCGAWLNDASRNW